MYKKYIVELTQEERDELSKIVKTNKGGFEKIQRARILLKADINGSGWSDKQIAIAEDCREQTVHNTRRRLVQKGFDEAVYRKKHMVPGRKKLLTGEQEATVIAMRLGDPPEGFGTWSLRLLADQVVERQITESVSHETIRQTLKKTV